MKTWRHEAVFREKALSSNFFKMNHLQSNNSVFNSAHFFTNGFPTRKTFFENAIAKNGQLIFRQTYAQKFTERGKFTESGKFSERIKLAASNSLHVQPVSENGKNSKNPFQKISSNKKSSRFSKNGNEDERGVMKENKSKNKNKYENNNDNNNEILSNDGDGDDDLFGLKCEHFENCSGCTMEKILHHPPILNDAKLFFKNYDIQNFHLHTLDVWNWRCKAKLVVQNYKNDLIIGLYEENTHIAKNIPNCRAHHPRINESVEIIKQVIRDMRIEPYNEQSGLGDIRYIQLVLTTNNTNLPVSERYMNGKVQVSFVWNARDENSSNAKNLFSFANETWKRASFENGTNLFHSIWANFQTSKSNVIFGGKWKHLIGEKYLWQKMGSIDMCFSPGSFAQANYNAFDKLLTRIGQIVPAGSSVTDLYSGAGVIGLNLAYSKNCRVKCVEINEFSKICFQKSLERNEKRKKMNISWHRADASENPIQWFYGSEILIFDPPRKGLENSLINALLAIDNNNNNNNNNLRKHSKNDTFSEKNLSNKLEKRPWRIKQNQSQSQSQSQNDKHDIEDEKNEKRNIFPTTLIYVSCGWEAFKRDCVHLTKDNLWHLSQVEAFQFFPGTDSMETLAVFKRGKKK